MGLRAKKPTIESNPRLKVLLYADKGAGKTHFCCSLPHTYYIDTENLDDYPHFKKMIIDNNGDMVYLTELTEIITEVKALLSTKHDYKNLIIDSISFPYGLLSQMEVDRLKTKHTEGTEYGANLAKGKRLTYQLGILLSMLDMNVFVTSHEKQKYIDGKDAGFCYDINDKMAYSLGGVWNLKLMGKDTRKLFIEKSRYPELKHGEFLDFNNGYESLVNIFGKEIFTRESKAIEFVTEEQLNTFNRLIKLLNVSEETIQTWLRTAKVSSIDMVTKAAMDKWITKLNSKIQSGDFEESTKGEAA